MKVYGIIMAGGEGTRFWPLSRKSTPKQFLNLTGEDLMVNLTYDRLVRFVEPENIFVVTNRRYTEQTLRLMEGRIDREHILEEPAARNTSACIGFAAMKIRKQYGDGIMCILASDHYIGDEDAYISVMKEAVLEAQQTRDLITIGIKPDYPATGYGYIKSTPAEGKRSRRVEEFVEKPDMDTASAYLADGGYVWNSGMFVWKASVILEYFERLLPDVYEHLLQIEEALNTPKEEEVLSRVYPVIPKISIDYGIMERADRVWMLEGNFGWSDLGSFESLTSLAAPDKNGNICRGEHILLDSAECICYAKDKLIAAIGVSGLVIAESEDVLLVCDRQHAQEIKVVVEQLEKEGRTEYI